MWASAKERRLDMGAVSYHKGIAYLADHTEAVIVRDRIGDPARVVEYQRGFAVQYRISGAYFPEYEEVAV